MTFRSRTMQQQWISRWFTAVPAAGVSDTVRKPSTGFSRLPPIFIINSVTVCLLSQTAARLGSLFPDRRGVQTTCVFRRIFCSDLTAAWRVFFTIIASVGPCENKPLKLTSHFIVFCSSLQPGHCVAVHKRCSSWIIVNSHVDYNIQKCENI